MKTVSVVPTVSKCMPLDCPIHVHVMTMLSANDVMNFCKVMSYLSPGYGALQVEAEVGKPRVNYLEAITQRVQFDYLHKKQSGESSSLFLH